MFIEFQEFQSFHFFLVNWIASDLKTIRTFRWSNSKHLIVVWNYITNPLSMDDDCFISILRLIFVLASIFYGEST